MNQEVNNDSLNLALDAEQLAHPQELFLFRPQAYLLKTRFFLCRAKPYFITSLLTNVYTER